MLSDFCVILYLGKAAAKLHVEAHRAERQSEKFLKKPQHFGAESSGKRNYSPAGLCVCLSDLCIVWRIEDLSTAQ